MMFGQKRKPVTILTGYLGSGKTTLLNELLKEERDGGLAVVVNDMGSINIDANLVKKNSVFESDTKMIELQNGCICCTLRDAFMEQLEQLAKDKSVKRIIVEASGISNPASIAEGFLAYDEVIKQSKVYLDSIVTVVDADRIYTEFLEQMQEIAEDEADTEDADIINLIMDQIEFCNLVILNKCDLLSTDQIKEVKKLIRTFQKEAEIFECIMGKVNADRIFFGDKFDYDKVMNSSAIQRALARDKAMQENEMDEYGVTSFVYEEKRPLDYDRFLAFMEQDYPKELIRAKGYLWFWDDDIHVQLFEQAGRNASITELSNWVAALPEEDQKEVFENYPEVLDEWDENYGDRMNQIVFIGKNYDKEKIISALDFCVAKEATLENQRKK
uniref:CobW family GTP-binding protein n=1 Tax=Roseburia hominis TaxID=301301 RepID=UPI004037C102